MRNITVLSIGLVVFLCFPTALYAAATGEVVVMQGSEPQNLDASISRGILELNPSMHIFDGLVRREANMELVPSLATSWNQLDDQTWEVKLREGVTFHDGKPLTAEDVQFTFERIIDFKTYKSGLKSLFSFLQEVIVVDDQTVQFKLNKPFASFIRHLALVPIVPKHAVLGMGHEKFIVAPVGTGPYRFVQWNRGREIILEANPAYWRGEAQIKRVIWKGVPEGATRVAALMAGDADIIFDVPVSFVDAIKARPGMAIKTAPGNRTMFLQVNIHKKPFDDIRVRKALAYAIDVDSIIEHVLRGFAVRANGPLPPYVFGYSSRLEAYPYDPEKAKTLLREAGYLQGFVMSITAPLGRYLLGKEVVQAIAGNLEKVGIKVKLNLMETVAFWPYIRYTEREENVKRVDVNFWGMSSMTMDGFYNFSGTTLSGGSSNPFFSNPKADTLLAEALAASTNEVTEARFEEVGHLLNEELPYIFLYYTVNIYGVNDQKLEWEPRADERVYVYDMKLKR